MKLLLMLAISFAAVVVEARSLDEVLKSVSSNLVGQLKGKKSRVVVGDIPYGRTPATFQLGPYIGQVVTNDLINSSLAVVDRANLDRLLKEQELQSNALFDAKDAARIGKLAGADILVFGRFYANYRWLSLTVWALDVSTASIVAAADEREPMNPSLESDVEALIPGYKALQVDIKSYLADEKLCQALKPNMDLTEAMQVLKPYLKSDAQLSWQTYLMDDDIEGYQKYSSRRYPSAWRIGNWMLSPFPGDYEKDDDRTNDEIKKGRAIDQQGEELRKKIAAGQMTGIPIKSWVFVTDKSVPSSAYCLPKGNRRYNTDVDTKVRIPKPAAMPPSSDPVFVALAKALEAKLLPKMANLKGAVALTPLESRDSTVPSAIIGVLEDRLTVSIAQKGFRIVDRSSLERIIGEQKIQQSALFNPATMAKVGKLSGAQYLMVGSLEKTPTRFIESVRVVNVATGEFVAQAEAETPVSLTADDEQAAFLNLDEFDYPLSQEMSEAATYAPPAYMGSIWREKLLRQKISYFSDWVCERVSAGGSANAVIAEAHRRRLFDRHVDELPRFCKTMGSDTGAHGNVMVLGFSFKNMDIAPMAWKFDVVQNVGDAFCVYDAEKDELKFAQPYTMQQWKYEGNEGIAPLDTNALRGNCLKDGFDVWTSVRRDKKKNIR